MLRASVSNIDLFRLWKDDEDLDLDWILRRILEPEQTEAMKAGEAFHKALEHASTGDVDMLECQPYRFKFNCECNITRPQVTEISVSRQYGQLEVRGRIDALYGNVITDYKTTSQFDPDRLMSGYQWRFYLDMAGDNLFRWYVFVLRETDDPMEYVVSDFHKLEQHRYPYLHRDCAALAEQYATFARRHIEPNRGKSLTQVQLERSLGITEADIAAV